MNALLAMLGGPVMQAVTSPKPNGPVAEVLRGTSAGIVSRIVTDVIASDGMLTLMAAAQSDAKRRKREKRKRRQARKRRRGWA